MLISLAMVLASYLESSDTLCFGRPGGVIKSSRLICGSSSSLSGGQLIVR